MEILSLDGLIEKEYTSYISSFPDTLLYVSIPYRNLISAFTKTEFRYLVAMEDDSIEGVLPLFIKKNDKLGTVINSLPFYGSNGGIISNNIAAKRELINRYKQIIIEENALSATIIVSPFEDQADFYDDNLVVSFKDSRVGQITIFPESSDKLMDIFHYKTRNTIRKGIKMNVIVEWENGMQYIDFLFDVHKENMEKIGGAYKPKDFFNLIPNHFKYSDEYRIYVAFIDGIPIAALLTFYFNKTVEYFSPVTVDKYREYQPMSVLIHKAMQDAVDNGYKKWNWGGTWLTQDGVYDFKKRWGTSDFNYYYYTTVNDDSIMKLSKETLLKEYPYYFVLPFHALSNYSIL